MKLEKGMSFEVVEVLDNELNATKGQQGVNFGKLIDSNVYQNVCTDVNDFDVHSINQTVTLLTINEIKPIGRLIIKEVKNA